ncbi:DUF4334 domain-containing protein [Nigerium massiliense]|uniref:DUF4334 domain-containing protein n=1 Tax=Nigerium massiliense TaxID=1522317 RepID=UPI00058D5D68|nr:DUF4334 domain-containing protein [Nigerium massiliense]
MEQQRSDSPATLTRLVQGSTSEEALALYDGLPAVTIDQMIGQWKGAGLPTGHPLDGLLEAMRWHGKRFRGVEEVDPLVMDGAKGTFALNPRFVPMGLATRFPSALRSGPVQRGALAVMPLLKTSRPSARLRMVEYRGVVTATMMYDALPVSDHFRLVDENTVVGAMDMRGWDRPFLFVLHREGVSE